MDIFNKYILYIFTLITNTFAISKKNVWQVLPSSFDLKNINLGFQISLNYFSPNGSTNDLVPCKKFNNDKI